MPNPTPPQIANPTKRLYYLDWLRVLAIFMVFLYHAVHPFDLPGWHIKNAEQSDILTIITVLLGFWGMPFFFLVAGTASWFALQRRTTSQYVSERSLRLVIPYIVGTILFWLPVMYFEWGNRVYLGATTLSFQEYLLNLLQWFVSLGFSPIWLSFGNHLWFIGFLFAFALLSLPIFLWLKRERGTRVIAWLASVSEHRGGILVFLLPLLIIQLSLRPFFLREHDWADFIFQLSFYILGFILIADERFTRVLRRDWWIAFALGTAVIIMMVVMYAGMKLPLFDWGGNPTIPQFYLMFTFITIIALTYTLTMFFVGMRFLDYANQWLTYAQEAVLPFFILHQPIIVVIAFYVVQWQTGILPKMVTVVASSFLIAMGLYEFVIRRIAPLRLLFGMTK